ncbi:MAG: 2-amino-4-hydroxy-6-hydroxymethyldihydropteridine diphosphokinase [Pseudorhodoplanes sp.]|nr:2-amino-4-hydroxy-6-hydroxymethyldihydropteridine diphosphokinase [Pseudorhodoplanes sp.]
MAEALIALGGNVGDARATIAKAIAVFCDGDDVVLLRRSSDYRTPPWGVADQAPFVNACITVSTALTPPALLRRAHSVERAFGRDREREERWGPRTLDIDVLAYEDLVLHEPDITLPHPRVLERAFVLVPLAEIAPDRQISGIRVRDALARVDSAGIERMP